MSPAGDETVDPKLLFVVGCPRSGTTWLQLLLQHHSAVSTLNETHLFSQFLGPMLESWDSLEESRRDIGLSGVFSRDEFVARLRALGWEAMQSAVGEDTRIVVEKTPGHALWGRQILEVFPDAFVVHLVRDPRDVVASLLAASRTWGEDWAPHSAYDAAWWWRDHVIGGRRIAGRTKRYRELAYEDLHAAPAPELAKLLCWTELAAPDQLVESAVEETSLARMREGDTAAPWDLSAEPEGFVRKGGSGNWTDDLTRSEARIVEHVAGDLMDDLGYQRKGGRAAPPIVLFPYWVRDRLLDRLR